MTLDWLKRRPIAHRGLHDKAKNIEENSLSAFLAAMDQNFPIMLDACLTKDGVVVVYHEHLSPRFADIPIIECLAKDVIGQRLGESEDVVLSLADVLKELAGRIPVLVNLHGNPPSFDTGLVTSISDLLRNYNNKSAMLATEAHLLRRFPVSAEGVRHGIWAQGIQRSAIELNFSMLAHDVQFVVYNKDELPNAFARFVRQRLQFPILAGIVCNMQEADASAKMADQFVFEGFNPDEVN